MDQDLNYPDYIRHKQSDRALKSTLFAHISPQALQRVLGPDGPRRIAGVDLSLIPQC